MLFLILVLCRHMWLGSGSNPDPNWPRPSHGGHGPRPGHVHGSHHHHHHPPPTGITIPAPLKRTGDWHNIKTLYHCTKREFARSIVSNMEFKPGKSGMFGAGIYFAETPEQAKSKAANDGNGDAVTVTAEVYLGFMLEVPSARHSLTKDEVYSYGCHSVHGLASGGSEYIVFTPHSIRVTGVVGL
jgi:hypothetical protein